MSKDGEPWAFQSRFYSGMTNDARIILGQTGTVIGLLRATDTNELSEQEQARAIELLKESNILRSPSRSEQSGQTADLANYQLIIIKGQMRYSYTFDDGTLPQSLRPLRDYLTQRGKPRSPKEYDTLMSQ